MEEGSFMLAFLLQPFEVIKMQCNLQTCKELFFNLFSPLGSVSILDVEEGGLIIQSQLEAT